MGGVIIVVADAEASEVGQVFGVGFFNHLLWRDALFFGGEHDGRAVRVVGAAVVAFVAAQFLEAHPDVGLDVFHHVPQVDAAVGIGQGGGDEDFALGHQSSPYLNMKSSLHFGRRPAYCAKWLDYSGLTALPIYGKQPAPCVFPVQAAFLPWQNHRLFSALCRNSHV